MGQGSFSSETWQVSNAEEDMIKNSCCQSCRKYCMSVWTAQQILRTAALFTQICNIFLTLLRTVYNIKDMRKWGMAEIFSKQWGNTFMMYTSGSLTVGWDQKVCCGILAAKKKKEILKQFERCGPWTFIENVCFEKLDFLKRKKLPVKNKKIK